MAKNTNNKTEAAPARLDAFQVEEFEVNGEKRSSWNKVGTAWPHADGKGFRLVLKAFPTDGVVILRAPEPKED